MLHLQFLLEVQGSRAYGHPDDFFVCSEKLVISALVASNSF